MSAKVYVGNLPSNLTRADLLAHFNDVHDDILKIDIATDREGGFRGYCYFVVADEETANRICDEYNKTVMQDHHIRVNRAMQRHLHASEIGEALIA